MNEPDLSKAFQLIEPGPVVLVTTAHKEKASSITMSRHMAMEFTPQLGCIVSRCDYSFAALRSNKAITANVCLPLRSGQRRHAVSPQPGFGVNIINKFEARHALD
ncbi:hypothetical protein MTYP_02030 [Methylophilaceae bacterium]|nr:hypothetical protein MTYP_02030 [Methylophilaceae bacterium]